MKGLVSRRHLLSIVVAAGSAATLDVFSAEGADGAAAAPVRVNEKDPLPVALGYVSDAKHVDTKASPIYQAGASCSSCSWYQGKPDDPAGGPCTFFPGKLVDSHAWCRMWSKKQ
jgi:high potential iron-sulfur protein